MAENENKTHGFKKLLKRVARRVLAPVLSCPNFPEVPQTGTAILCTTLLLSVCLNGRSFAAEISDGVDVVNGVTWYYTLRDGKATIVKGAIPYVGDLVVPTTVDGYPVVEIAGGSFQRMAGLTSVVIPEGVETVGSGALAYNSDLVRVVFPDSATNIVEGCFYESKNLSECRLPKWMPTFSRMSFKETAMTEIVVPDGVTFIGDCAFYLSTKLARVTLPDTLEIVDWGAFHSCSSLTSIEFPSAFKSFGVYNGGYSGELHAVFGKCTSLKTAIFHGTVPQNLTYSWLLQLGCKIYYPKAFAAQWETVVPAGNFGGYTEDLEPDPSGIDVKPVATGYEPGVAIEPIAVSYAGTDEKPQIAVTGLPKGLVYANGQITGTPNEPGVSTVVVNVKSGKVVVATRTVDIRVNNYTDVLATLEDAYGPFIPGAPFDLALRQVQCWKAKGVPSGLAFNSEAGRLSGVPKKPGDYTIVFTKAVGYATHAVSTTITIAPLREVSVAVEGEGTAKGAGAFAAQAKAALSAKAAKGWVLQGWYDARGTCLSQEASYSYRVTEDALQPLTVRFVLAADDGASIVCRFGETELSSETPMCVTNYQGVAFTVPLHAEALSKATVKAAGLPAGLKLVEGEIAGAPTGVSKTDKTGAYLPVKATVTVKTAAGNAVKYPLEFVVLPRAANTVGTFTGVYSEAGVYCGSVTLTVAANGTCSGRLNLLRAGKAVNVTLSAKALSAYSADEKTATCELGLKGLGAEPSTVLLCLMPDRQGVGLASSFLDACEFALVQDVWKNPPEGRVTFATSSREAVTLACANGLNLKFGAKGKVTYAGTVPGDEGTPVSVSGASTLLMFAREGGAEEACLVVYVAPKKNLKQGFVTVVPLVFTTDAQGRVTAAAEGGTVE